MNLEWLVSTNWHWPRQAPGWRDALCRVLLSWRARRPSLQNIWTVAVALRATRTLRAAKRLQGLWVPRSIFNAQKILTAPAWPSGLYWPPNETCVALSLLI